MYAGLIWRREGRHDARDESGGIGNGYVLFTAYLLEKRGREGSLATAYNCKRAEFIRLRQIMPTASKKFFLEKKRKKREQAYQLHATAGGNKFLTDTATARDRNRTQAHIHIYSQ